MKRLKLKLIAILLTAGMLLGGYGGGMLPVSVSAKSDTAPNTIDLMEKAINASGYRGTGLEDLPYYTIGAGYFRDYISLHNAPLNSADYIWDMRGLARGVTPTGEGLAGFCTAAVRDFGFRYDASAAYTVYDAPEDALTALFEAAGLRSVSAEAKKALARVSSDAKEPLAEWLSAAVYGYRQIIGQTSNVSYGDVSALLNFLCCPPASDDIGILNTMRNISNTASVEAVLKGGIAVLSASETLSGALLAGKALTTDGKACVIPTPLGDIILGSMENDTYTSPGALLILEPGGNDTYEGRIAAGCVWDTPISVLIDFSGDDIYTADDGFTQGAGVLGVGILFDMQGEDRYTASRLAQGACVLGMGVLFDSEGNDSYELDVTGQGSGLYGLAILSDGAGNDIYDAIAYAQASAGPRCMAYLLDIAGDDEYYVQPYGVGGYEVLLYGQFPGINGNWSQGCGWGQRVIDLSGGVAGLMDLSGNDTFTGGIWVQGVGYWSGIGFLFNENGNDSYNSFYYSQASVAHFGIGILTDVGGDDIHNVRASGGAGGDGASLAFTWDRGTAVFVNDGGNDVYSAGQTSGGVAMSAYDEKGYQAQDMTYAIFVDTEGDDTYSIGGNQCLGWGRGGYLIDAGGEDTIFNGWRRNNALSSGLALEGGIHYDYAVTTDPPDTPIIGFWEEAKARAAFPFVDVTEGDAFYDAVRYVYKSGLMIGTSDTEFSPEMTVDRSQFVTVLGRLAGIDTDDYAGTPEFSDVKADAWYTPYVAWASKNGIVLGYDTGAFGVTDTINVEQAALILARYAAYTGVDTSSSGDVSGYADSSDTSDWARQALMWAVEKGIYVPEGNHLKAKAPAPRSLVATMMYYMADDGETAPGKTPEETPEEPVMITGERYALWSQDFEGMQNDADPVMPGDDDWSAWASHVDTGRNNGLAMVRDGSIRFNGGGDTGGDGVGFRIWAVSWAASVMDGVFTVSFDENYDDNRLYFCYQTGTVSNDGPETGRIVYVDCDGGDPVLKDRDGNILTRFEKDGSEYEITVRTQNGSDVYSVYCNDVLLSDDCRFDCPIGNVTNLRVAVTASSTDSYITLHDIGVYEVWW